MALDVEDVIAGLDPERGRKIEERAAELIAEELTLRELRKARKLTQARVARELGIGQDAISRLEQRSDLLLSTLRNTVEAMGGNALAHRAVPRPPTGRALRHRRARGRRLTPARTARPFRPSAVRPLAGLRPVAGWKPVLPGEPSSRRRTLPCRGAVEPTMRARRNKSASMLAQKYSETLRCTDLHSATSLACSLVSLSWTRRPMLCLMASS